MQVNPEDHPQDIYVTWSNPRMTDFENAGGGGGSQDSVGKTSSIGL